MLPHRIFLSIAVDRYLSWITLDFPSIKKQRIKRSECEKICFLSENNHKDLHRFSLTHTVTYLKMVPHTVTYVCFHTALFNQESRKDFITITKISTAFSSRKKDDTARNVFFYRITITRISFNKEITSEQLWTVFWWFFKLFTGDFYVFSIHWDYNLF